MAPPRLIHSHESNITGDNDDAGNYVEHNDNNGEQTLPSFSPAKRPSDDLTESTDSVTSFTSDDGSCSSSDLEEGKALLSFSDERDDVDDNVTKPQQCTRDQAFKLCFGVVGIYTCYLAYGSLQEDIFRYRAEDGSNFRYAWFLQVMECVFTIVVGIIGRCVCGGTTPKSLMPYFGSGASQVFATVLGSLSLAAGLSFPVCMLAKSAKMVPVMLGQLVLGGSTYSWIDYMSAGAVVAGTATLSMGKKASSSASSFSTPAGVILIILSLGMDGVTGGLQKRLKKETADHPPTTYDFLLFTNLAMFMVASSIALVLGDFGQGMWFMAQNPQVLHQVLLYCFVSAMGQSFIFFVVATFDPMVCATVTTTRKIFSVLWSIAFKGHSISHVGFVGLAIAIGGILLGLYEQARKKGPKFH